MLHSNRVVAQIVAILWPTLDQIEREKSHEYCCALSRQAGLLSQDTSSDMNYDNYIYKLVERKMNELAVDNVVQIITVNA